MPLKRFIENDSTAVFTTRFVVHNRKDITHVYHFKEDGAWQFSSDDEFENYEQVAMLVGLGEIVKLDMTLLEIADLPEGYFAQSKFKAING